MKQVSDMFSMAEFSMVPLRQGRLYTAGLDAPGPVILFVHGGYHGAWCWRNFMRWFSDLGYPCAAVDIRGHGGLSQANDYVSQGIADYAQDVVDAGVYLDRSVVIVGHSLGALVGMLAAQRLAPIGQILLAPSPPGQLDGLIPLKGYCEGKAIQPPAPEVSQQKFFAGNPFDMNAFQPMLCAESPAAMNDRYLLKIHIDPNWIKGPTLCLSAGDDSRALHPPGQDEATALFFNGEHRTLVNAPHNVMLDESWQTTIQLLANFYDTVAPAR